MFLSAVTLLANRPGWSDEYEKSLAEAKAGKKLTLLDFTGSDWCGCCIKLDKEVFSQPEFKKVGELGYMESGPEAFIAELEKRKGK